VKLFAENKVLRDKTNSQRDKYSWVSDLSRRLYFSLIILKNINSTEMVRMKHVPIRRKSITHIFLGKASQQWPTRVN
jgi:hypothetical protein